MDEYIDEFIRACILDGWDYDAIEVALEDEYGLTALQANSSWFPRCIGKAVNTLKNLKRGDKIIITKLKFTNERKQQDDGTYKSFFRFLILDGTIDTGEGESSGESAPAPAKTSSKTKADKKAKEEPAEEAESDCPW